MDGWPDGRPGTYAFTACYWRHRSVLYFYPDTVPPRLFELYVHHVTADKLVNLPPKMEASSVERCWTVCGRNYLANT